MYLVVKRFVEFSLSLLALIILSPLLVPVMIILKLTGEYEVIFLQKRIGYKNKEFNIWKFATMMKNSPTMGSRGNHSPG